MPAATMEIFDAATDAVVAALQIVLADIAESATLPEAAIREWYSPETPLEQMLLVDTESVTPTPSAAPGYRRVQISLLVGLITHFDMTSSRANHRAVTAAMLDVLADESLYDALAIDGWAIDLVVPGPATQATQEMDDYRRRNFELTLYATQSGA